MPRFKVRLGRMPKPARSKRAPRKYSSFDRPEQLMPRCRQSAEQVRQGERGIALHGFDVVHPGDPRELGFEMQHRLQIRIVIVQVGESTTEQRKELRFMMIRLRAEL